MVVVRFLPTARSGLGRASWHPHRGPRPARRWTRVRDASARAADLSPPQGGGAHDCRAARRDGLRRNDVLDARVHAGAAHGAAGGVNRRPLGRTGLSVSEVGFGAWGIGGNAFGNSYGPTDDAESTRAIRRAFELGCNFFDTADVYGHGHSETLLGAALHDVRDQVFFATKAGGNFYNRDMRLDFTPGYLRFAVERSLERLRADHIDLLQLHNPPINLISARDAYEPLEEMKREGLIRFYGVSVHPPEEGMAAVQATMPDTVQIVYNLARREAEDTFLPTAHPANVGVIAREPLANGFLARRYNAASNWERGDIRSRMPRPSVAQLSALGQPVRELAENSGLTASQLALKFVLDRQEIASAIVGMKTVQQVEENLNSGV